VEQRPEIKTKVGEWTRNVPEVDRQRAFLSAACTEPMAQGMRATRIQEEVPGCGRLASTAAVLLSLSHRGTWTRTPSTMTRGTHPIHSRSRIRALPVRAAPKGTHKEWRFSVRITRAHVCRGNQSYPG
jgi:hypothetical protein